MRTSNWGLACLIALASTFPASANVLITIDKSTQQMTVAVDGVTRWQWPVSTGRAGHDTPTGTFQAFRMEADHYSKEWDDAPMPHSIFFTKVGHAIHGYLDTRNIGAPASHGCVRLEPQNAAKLYALVQQEGVLKTTVVLRGDIALARRSTPPARAAAAPAPVSPQYAPPSQEAQSYRGSYDDRYAPQSYYRQAEPQTNYRSPEPQTYYRPPQPQPGYPPYPAPARSYDPGYGYSR